MTGRESAGAVLSSAAPLSGAAGGKFLPREFRRGPFGRFDRGFGLLLLICGAVVFTVTGILSSFKPPQTISEEEIVRIQERYARLVLNQPKPVIEPKVAQETEEIVTREAPAKEEEKKEEVKIDREKETFIEKERRKESGIEQRRQVREEAAKRVQSSGIFAAITAAGNGLAEGSGSSVSDLLGSPGLGVTDLGSMTLDKGTFATDNVDAADLVSRKENRTTDVNIEKEEVGRTSVARVASNIEVNVTTQPPQVSGESSDLAERSQSAIQNIVSRESRRLKRLYEEWLKRDPALKGRLTVKFVILPSGAVSNVTIVKSNTGNNEFDEMVLRYIRRWQFSEIEGAGPVEVVYPFVFEGQS